MPKLGKMLKTIVARGKEFRVESVRNFESDKNYWSLERTDEQGGRLQTFLYSDERLYYEQSCTI